jgi:hypothetical protein
MKLESSSPRPQQPATGPHSEPSEVNTQFPTQFLNDPSQFYFLIYTLVFQVVIFLRSFRSIFCMHL